MAEQTLAERLVQHPVWGRDDLGWARGMVCVGGAVCLAPSDPEGRILFSSWEAGESYTWTADPAERDIVPDIEHPATRGWLLEQCDAASDAANLGDVELWKHANGGWCVSFGGSADHDYEEFNGDTKGEAVATATLWAFDRLVEQEAGNV